MTTPHSPDSRFPSALRAAYRPYGVWKPRRMPTVTLMAGYSGTPLPKKLGITKGMTVGILNAPDHFELGPGDLPDGVVIHRTEEPADVYLVFADRIEEARHRFRQAMNMLPADGAIWIAWPKKSSGVETDIRENTLRDVFLPTGMVDNKVCAIDDTWSGLRFVVRKENRPEWGRGGFETP